MTLKRSTMLFFAFTLSLFVLNTGVFAQQENWEFRVPTKDGQRVDWCKYSDEDCGKPAADFYCRLNGFKEANAFEIDPDIGGSHTPTVVLGDDGLCTLESCDSFKFIQCSSRIIVERPPQRVPPILPVPTGEFPFPPEPPKDKEDENNPSIDSDPDG